MIKVQKSIKQSENEFILFWIFQNSKKIWIMFSFHLYSLFKFILLFFCGFHINYYSDRNPYEHHHKDICMFTYLHFYT